MTTDCGRNCNRACVTGSDLTGSDLTGSDLTGSDLTGSGLTSSGGSGISEVMLEQQPSCRVMSVNVHGSVYALCSHSLKWL